MSWRGASGPAAPAGTSLLPAAARWGVRGRGTCTTRFVWGGCDGGWWAGWVGGWGGNCSRSSLDNLSPFAMARWDLRANPCQCHRGRVGAGVGSPTTTPTHSAHTLWHFPMSCTCRYGTSTWSGGCCWRGPSLPWCQLCHALTWQGPLSLPWPPSAPTPPPRQAAMGAWVVMCSCVPAAWTAVGAWGVGVPRVPGIRKQWQTSSVHTECCTLFPQDGCCTALTQSAAPSHTLAVTPFEPSTLRIRPAGAARCAGCTGGGGGAAAACRRFARQGGVGGGGCRAGV